MDVVRKAMAERKMQDTMEMTGWPGNCVMSLCCGLSPVSSQATRRTHASQSWYEGTALPQPFLALVPQNCS